MMVPHFTGVKTLSRRLVLLGSACLWASVTLGGEPSGLPPHLPPTTQPDYTFFLGNDFLAPGTNDDFRTQQIIASARIRNRWLAVIDQSILTRADAVSGPPARIDLMTLSLGYEWLRHETADGLTTLAAGTGVRGVGNYEGSRIQNGFHTLIETGTSFLPYATTRKSGATAWLLAEHHRILRRAPGAGLWSGWDTGYWLRAGALTTTDSQFDGVAGAFLVATRPGFDAWLGLRRDWREGYSADFVQAETAQEERKTALVYGVRLGSFVLETVQRFGSHASYGQVSFVSSMATRKQQTERDADADLQLGLHIPHMLLQLKGRWHRPLFLDAGSAWRESFVVDLRAGQPQLGRDVTRFVETAQLTAGLEWSRQLVADPDWLRFYVGAAAGYRNEKLVGRGDLDGVRSARFGRAVLTADVGIEVDAARIRNNWRHRLRFGLTGWLPAESVTVTAGGLASELLEPGASIVAAWTFNYY